AATPGDRPSQQLEMGASKGLGTCLAESSELLGRPYKVSEEKTDYGAHCDAPVCSTCSFHRARNCEREPPIDRTVTSLGRQQVPMSHEPAPLSISSTSRSPAVVSPDRGPGCAAPPRHPNPSPGPHKARRARSSTEAGSVSAPMPGDARRRTISMVVRAGARLS